MSTGLVLGTSTSLIVFIVALALSTYGLGKEEKDMQSSAYKTATIFTQVGATGIVIALILLIIAVLRLCSVSSTMGSAMNYQ